MIDKGEYPMIPETIKPFTVVEVKSGRFKGQSFEVEGTATEVCGSGCLATLSSMGNWAARNAINVDGYKVNDKPFYYGKIGALGYIISAKDLGLGERTP